MKDVIYLLFNLLTTLAKLLRPGGGRAVIAENLLLKQPYSVTAVGPERSLKEDVYIGLQVFIRRF